MDELPNQRAAELIWEVGISCSPGGTHRDIMLLGKCNAGGYLGTWFINTHPSWLRSPEVGTHTGSIYGRCPLCVCVCVCVCVLLWFSH